MLALLFINAALLAGLTALALPVLIHLLLKRKKQQLRFSTLRFFRRHDEHSSQRRKLRNLLLLAVRLLLLAVLVLAFARPFLAENEAAGTHQKRRLVVFVLDRSASMQAIDAGVPRWPKAKESIQKVLAELKPNDRAALISCASHCEVLSGAAPPETIIRLLKDLQPAYGSGNVGEGLQLAGRIASSAGDSVPAIYVVSDLQISACKNLSAYSVPAQIEVNTIKIGDVLAPNLAVTQFRLDSTEADRPHVVIANYSDEPTKEVRVELMIDGKETPPRSVTFASGTVARADLLLPALTPGWHSGAARITGEDALALDNVRYAALFVPQRVRTLVVETRPAKRLFEEESFFVTSALDPTEGATNAGFSRFAVEKVSPEGLLKKLSSTSERTNYELVILPGLDQIPSGLTGGLLEFVRAGGGLLFFLNDSLNPNRYNTDFRELLPAQLGHLQRNTSDSADSKWHLDDYDSKAAMFSAFRRPGSGNLALPEFTRRCTLSPLQGSMVPAKFGDGTAAIVSLVVGSGRVVLVNTSADTSWTDWPKRKTYVPWLHSLCFALSARAGADQMRTATQLVAGEDHSVSLGIAARLQTYRVHRVGEKETSLTADQTGHLPNLDFIVPGVYSIADSAAQEMQRIAVNLPAEESDLTALTAMEFQREIPRAPAAPKPALAASFFGSEDQRKDLARLLLTVGLGLLFAETFLANRTYA